jgi:heme/copper-type cytochrome/quinol oxidase subunit 2
MIHELVFVVFLVLLVLLYYFAFIFRRGGRSSHESQDAKSVENQNQISESGRNMPFALVANWRDMKQKN